MSVCTLTSILKEACIVTLIGAPDCDAGQAEQRGLERLMKATTIREVSDDV